ncbi:glycoside hydrolase, partial [Amylostereum chailletii]
VDGNMVSTTIPKNLKAGNYLLRSELIALHTAGSVGGAEFYPGCVQLKVGGDATGTASPTVSIPGLYSDSDPGI